MSASDIPHIEQNPTFWGSAVASGEPTTPLSRESRCEVAHSLQRVPLFEPAVLNTNANEMSASLERWKTPAWGTIVAGATLAAFLHLGDLFPPHAALPSAIGGVALHLLPSLLALILSAILCVFPHKRGGLDAAQSQLANRYLILIAAFSVTWTSFEWMIHRHRVASLRHDAIPVETLFTLVTVLFYGISQASRRHGALSGHRSVFVCGTGPVATGVKDYLESRPHLGYRVRSVLHLHRGQEPFVYAEQLIRQARHMFANEILLTAHPGLDCLEHIFEHARTHRIGVLLIPDISEVLLDTSAVAYIGSLPFIRLYTVPQRRMELYCKRALDIAISAALLVLLSPVFLILATLVRLESDGPSFYANKRVGLKGRTFTCYKFRTMVRDADALRHSLSHLNEREGILFKISKDPRITRLGAWLRKYSLDELPQLWNVLRGDMSLVGPRPSLPSEVQQYETRHLRRLDVVPGMTGLWQVEARCDPSFESYIVLDSKYADNWSLSMDLRILARTFRIVLLGTGV